MIDTNTITAVKSLSPTAARIFIIILLGRGQSFTGRELAAMVGKTEATTSMALRELEVNGMVQYNGYSNGWSLPLPYQQLPLPVDSPVDNSGQEFSILLEESKTLPPNSISLVSSDPYDDLTNYQASAEKSKTLHAGSENTAPSDLETKVEAWLIRGGIVAGSPKLRFLVQKIQSPEYAKAHVLQHLHERRAWEKAPKNGREPGTGTLIYRLEHGWDAPPMRCETCFERERDCRCNGRSLQQHIPDDLKNIVRR